MDKVHISHVTSIVRQDLKPVQSVMTGHFASVCRTKSKQEQKKKNTRKQGGRRKVDCVEDGEDDEYAFTVGFGRSWNRSGSEMVDLQVGSAILNGVLIDSGSSCNITNQRL